MRPTGSAEELATPRRRAMDLHESGICSAAVAVSGGALQRCRTFWRNAFKNSALLDKLMLRREFLCGPSRAINELGLTSVQICNLFGGCLWFCEFVRTRFLDFRRIVRHPSSLSLAW
jgi:hypothetical protein